MRKIIDTQYHRNGVCGNPFYCFLFKDDNHTMFAVQFTDDPLSTAVFDLELLSKGNIRFGINSFRGDHYADWLKKVSDNSENLAKIELTA